MAPTAGVAGRSARGPRKSRKRANAIDLKTARDECKADLPSRSGLGATYIDPERQRTPPPPATPVTFPQHYAYQSRSWGVPTDAPDLKALFGRISKPRDIATDHIEALNIAYTENVTLEELLPLAQDGRSYLPPVTAKQVVETDEYTNPSLDPNAGSKRKQDFHNRLAELRVENDIAYRSLARSLPRGVDDPRLTYMRKFFQGLESMSPYWECADDRYYGGDTGEDESGDVREGRDAKRVRLEGMGLPERSIDQDVGIDQVSGSIDETEHVPSVDQAASSTSPDDTSAANELPAAQDIQNAEPRPAAETRTRYKGRRTSTGTDMPTKFRSDMVRSFVEGTIWPFQCLISPPRKSPIIQLNTLNVPVRQTAAVYKQPNDRTQARQGYMLGPILAIQVRAELSFSVAEPELSSLSQLDLVHELGVLLQIAQERRREGKKEIKCDKGKWWTTRARFGGAPKVICAQREGSGDAVPETARLSVESASADPRLGRRKSTPLARWEEVSCGSGYWDPRTEYVAIGKDHISAYDEVKVLRPFRCVL
ncbi:hypothetical protein LTR62_002750 [Meristemomyces frigidus]|uniref:Uncharacterized protein n=1 Tax=Meristemomyces frigidus TaxID=1508187 RepID=A0AAN7TLW8_9PEZI|nr:hypothetical protein LTR62_002750 [Meristemomyces frigidus]